MTTFASLPMTLKPGTYRLFTDGNEDMPWGGAIADTDFVITAASTSFVSLPRTLKPGTYRLFTDGNEDMPSGGPVPGTDFVIAADSSGCTGTGADGKSAYQLAVDAGFVGSVTDWLASLKGQPGTGTGSPGESAYQIWLDAGNTGTTTDFLDSLKGKDGTDGTNGTNGTGGGTAPDFTTLVATIGLGAFVDWTWGDVVLPHGILVNMTVTCNGAGLDMHGAHITCQDATQDGLTFLCPNSNAPNTIVRGFLLRNFTLSGGKNGVVLSSPLGNSCIRGYEISGVAIVGCAESGLLLSGAVFEGDTWGLVTGSHGKHGAEMHQPAFGNNIGIMSSNNFYGGTFQDNGMSGIAETADVAFQEAQGVYLYGCNMINNGGPGFRGTGLALAEGCHTEANGKNHSGESRSGFFCYGGTAKLRDCDGTDSGGNQKYLLDIQSPGPDKVSSLIGCGAYDQGTGNGLKLLKLGAAGTVQVDQPLTTADYDSNGQWKLVTPVVSTTTI